MRGYQTTAVVVYGSSVHSQEASMIRLLEKGDGK